jgi:hypothetical protein
MSEEINYDRRRFLGNAAIIPARLCEAHLAARFAEVELR